MIQEIKFNGQTAIPADYDAPDGDLDIALNAALDNAQIAPIIPPDSQFTINPGWSFFVHQVSGNKTNYIAFDLSTSSLMWIGTATDGIFEQYKTISLSADNYHILNISAIGNILILTSSSNVFYVRFNPSENQYQFIGSKIPDLNLDFALKLNFTMSENHDKEFNLINVNNSSTETTTPDDDWSQIISHAYDVSGPAGTLKHEWYLLSESGKSSHVSTDRIPLDSSLKLNANCEYKVRWNVIHNWHDGMCLIIWGHKNGKSTPEAAVLLTYEGSLPKTIEKAVRLSDEWTQLSFTIHFPYKDESDPHCATSGDFSISKGLDFSESSPETNTMYIQYTSDSHNALMGAINKFVNESSTQADRFIFPFFLRYAVRLFDGNYAKISEPILMIPNSDYVPAVSYRKHSELGCTLSLFAFAADLKYRMRNSIPHEWSEIISGVDVFVSSPVYLYDQGQEYDGAVDYFRFYNSSKSFGFGCPYITDEPIYDVLYQSTSLQDMISKYGSYSIGTDRLVKVAPKSASKVYEDIVATQNFYKIKSLDVIDLDNALSSFVQIELNKGTLSSLVSRPALNDEYILYSGFSNAIATVYNSRLHLYNSEIILPPPALPEDMFNYLDAEPDEESEVFVYLKTNSGIRVVKSLETAHHALPWFFYPDSRAFKVRFITKLPDHQVIIEDFPLNKHEYLNGSFYFKGLDYVHNIFLSSVDENTVDLDAVNDKVYEASTIYVSEPNNPFVFKAASAVSVGASKILGLASSAKALSQGQFGQFPLYAFTDEGIWALETSSTGTYIARQPITRDICINPNGITQIDSAVLFPSDRGLMLISGSNAICISDIINNITPFNPDSIPHCRRLLADVDSQIPPNFQIVPLLDYIKDQNFSMLYDYANQRIIAFNNLYDYAYIYSLKSKLWSIMQSEIDRRVNSYPDAIAIAKDGRLLNFSRPIKDATPPNTLLISRPLKLGLPDTLKTVDTVIIRGNFQRGHVRSVLYGSRDLIHWHPVWSSKDHFLRGFHGSPYKYFRIALQTSLLPGESISGASISFTPRASNRIR